MPFDPSLVKKFFILIFVLMGLLVGYQFVSDKDIDELSEGEVDLEDAIGEGKYEIIDVNQATAPAVDDEGFEVTADMNIADAVVSLDDDQYGNKIQFNNSFEHTKPGEYSEIVVNASGFEPGEFTIVYVRFAGTENYIAAGGQEHTADADGNISTRFTITQFGKYEVFLTSKGESVVSPEIVVE